MKRCCHAEQNFNYRPPPILLPLPHPSPTPRVCAPNSSNSKGTERRVEAEEALVGGALISVQHHDGGEQRGCIRHAASGLWWWGRFSLTGSRTLTPLIPLSRFYFSTPRLLSCSTQSLQPSVHLHPEGLTAALGLSIPPSTCPCPSVLLSGESPSSVVNRVSDMWGQVKE